MVCAGKGAGGRVRGRDDVERREVEGREEEEEGIVNVR